MLPAALRINNALNSTRRNVDAAEPIESSETMIEFDPPSSNTPMACPESVPDSNADVPCRDMPTDVNAQNLPVAAAAAGNDTPKPVFVPVLQAKSICPST